MAEHSKERILLLAKYIQRHADEENPKSTRQIMDMLQQNGYPVDRKTLAADMETLHRTNMDIIRVRDSVNRYYVGDRLLDMPEMHMILDALEASNAISRAKTDSMIYRLTRLMSVHQSDILLKRKMVCNALKTDNNHVIYSIDLINRAIEEKKKISFQYYGMEPGRGKVLRHNGLHYHVSPYGLVWNQDRYYLIGWCEKHCGISHFRLDRMTMPEILDELAIPEPQDFSISRYTSGMFGMFSGETTSVTLRCANSTYSPLYDHFGEQADITPLGDDFFRAKVNVVLSSSFFSWIFQFGGDIEIQQPVSVRKTYKEMLRKTLTEYA